MVKRIVVVIAAVILSLGAAESMSNGQIIEAIKANPALLDSPQAKQYMQKKGLSAKKESGVKPGTTTAHPVDEASLSAVYDKNDTDIPHAVDLNASRSLSVKDFLKNPLTYEEADARFKRLMTQQIKEQTMPLRRYGESFFANKNGIDLASLPVPDGYRLAVNDTLSITLYGPKSDELSLAVDRDGTIVLPSFGPLHVAGLSFVEAKKVIGDALAQAFPNVGVVVTIAKYSTIQVTLAGEVTAPGVYNVTSFSTVKDALITAGGIAANGSMRGVEVKRGSRVIKVVDLYKIIRDGDKRQEVLLEAGDAIVVPIVKKTVTLEGGVKNPAIYEPKPNETLADILYYAGGLKAQSSKYDIKMTRYTDNEKVEIVSIDAKDAAVTKLKDQDRIYVYDLAAANMQGVTLYGNVVKPGFRALPQKGMTLSALLGPEIRQQTMKGVFLEQTLFDYAMIKRIDDNLSEQLIGFSLADALHGKTAVPLHNRDEIYIFNEASVRPIPKVTVEGECIVKPGAYRYLDNMTVPDLINTAGVSCAVPDYAHVKVLSYDPVTHNPVIRIVDLFKDTMVRLAPSDEVTLFNFYTAHPIPQVTLNGEINKPGTYPIGDATTLREVILAAGGVTDKADSKIEVVHYEVVKGKRTAVIVPYGMTDVMGEASPRVKAYDEITVFTIPDWGKKKTVKIVGKVRYPGEYTIQEGDKLSDVLRRAGGFMPEAFLDGAVFTRKDIKKIQEEAIQSQLRELEHKAAVIAASPKTTPTPGVGGTDSLMSMIGALKEQAKTMNVPGRMSIRLDRDTQRLSQSPYNIVLKDGDALYVPEKEDSVSIVGEVMNPSAMIHTTDDPDFYVAKAGGMKDSADASSIFIVHANGEAEKLTRGYLFNSGAKVGPGDSIVVPLKLDAYPTMMFVKDITAILYQFAVTAAALKTIGSL